METGHMKRLDRLVRNSMILATAGAIVVIVCLDMTFSLIDQIQDTNEGYSTLDAMVFVLWTAPASIHELLPFAALGGALIGLGILASNNELVVMQSAGVSVGRIVYAVLKPTLAIMLLGLLLGEYIAPPLEREAQSNRAALRSAGGAADFEQGAWYKTGDEFVHINAISPDGASLIGVSRYRTDGGRELLAASFAETAEFVADAAEPYWRLREVRESTLEGNRVVTGSRNEQEWQVDLSPDLLGVLLVEPDQQSISGLYRMAGFLAGEGLDSAAHFLAFWKKLLQPLSTLVLVLVAVFFVFGPLREATMGYRVFVALSVGLVFTIVQRVVEPVSLLFGLSPLLAAATPILLCAILGWALLRRIN
ncbi:MAG: LPS export ABC transporter permease LptG [Gammaproteobacteria bacterium]|nr:LPS export ABC transporter permease LptG [Gammaproteobacteria bacterium]MYL12465.1 LPS export ABC transporter permease LptG [Gammaproteobacteria bacterium]